MSRAIELQDNRLIVRYDGLDALLVLRRELVVYYHAIAEATVGLPEAPSTWSPRRLGLADPITGSRRGRFWTRGTRWFLDLRRPERALVIRLKPGYEFDAVAIEPDHPESLLSAIRDRVAAA